MNSPAPTKTKKFWLAFSVAAILAVSAYFALPAFLKGQLATTLKKYGADQVSIGSTSYVDGHFLFADIQIDENGFSQIKTIRARVNWPGILLSGRPFSDIYIDDAVITLQAPEGLTELRQSGIPSLASLAGAENIFVNSATMDLVTPEGGLRLNLKARAEGQADSGQHQKKKKVQGALWAEQHQLTIDSTWQGTVSSDRSWAIESDINNLRINFDKISLSRGSGWIIAENKRGDTGQKNAPVSSIAGQVRGGQVQIGDHLKFVNTNFVFEGRTNYMKTVFTADSASYPQTTLSAEIDYVKRKVDKIRIEARTTDLNTLFSFMTDMKTSLQAFTSLGDSLTPLLITQGNLDRIRHTLERSEYDYLDLIISGTVYDLTGKIVAKSSDEPSPVTEVVSMNPGLTD